jgi:hypothetical protein
MPLPGRIDVIFLDMDGVLCDFHTSVARLWGLDPRAITDDTWAEIGEWGIGVPMPDFWDRIEAEGRAWWEGLAKLPWADELVDACRRRADRVAILTSPAPFAACHEGKRAWVSAQLGAMDVVITSAKALCSGSRRILIDDRTKYAGGWEAAGGTFVPLRRPWTGGGVSAGEIIGRLRS